MGGVRKPFHVRTKRGSAFWWADFTLASSRYRFPLTVKNGDDRAKAEQEAGTRWLEECARQGIKATAPAELRTKALLVRYIETELAARARKRGPRYAEIEEIRLGLHVQPRFPVVTEITPTSWDTHVEELHAQGLKLDTIRKVTISCRLFLKWCGRISAIALVPSLRAPAGEECALEVAERRAFTRAERDAFLAALDGRAKRIYTVLLYTALRKSALERMLPRWIDWQTGYVTFPASAMKKRKPKSFYLHPLAQKAIKEELEGRERDLAPVFGPFDYDGHNGAARSGVFWTACREANIPLDGLTAHHVCRHTAATIAGNDGASLAELMRLGGWDTPAAALRYMHASDEQARKAVERL